MIPLTPAADGAWQTVAVAAPPTGGRLAAASLTVDPPTAFRKFRVRRQSDNETLVSGGWLPSRDRPMQIFPLSDWVGPGDTVRLDVCTWGATACEGRLTWAD